MSANLDTLPHSYWFTYAQCPIAHSGTYQQECETYRTSQSTHLDRAQQWRQVFRGSLSTTCVSYNQSDEIPSPTQLTNPPVNLDERQRLPRQLPTQPFRNSNTNAQDLPSATRRHYQSKLDPSDSLAPPQIGQVHRASSFDGRLRHSALQETRNSPSHQRARRTNSSLSNSIAYSPPTSLSSASSGKRGNFSPAQSDLTGRRERLVVAPSIEISLAGDCSSSSEGDDEELFEQKSTHLREARRVPSQTSVGTFSDSYSDSQMSGSRAIPRAPTQLTPQSRGMQEQTNPPRNLSRPKLTRQPRSFQAEPFSNRLQGSSPLMDEFDYFCQIANSPSGSRDKELTRYSDHSGSLSPARHHVTAGRSHSVRTTSPETAPVDSRPSNVTNSRGNRINPDLSKPSLLRPPARGQLRRASTEEERFKHPIKDRTPVSATLSYSPVNVSVQNVCRGSPKSVPKLPSIGPPNEPSQDVPIGVPISEDSLFADKPGMTFYQVQVLGAIGVGKTSLCQQLSRLKTGKPEIRESSLISVEVQFLTARCHSRFLFVTKNCEEWMWLTKHCSLFFISPKNWFIFRLKFP